MSINIKSPLEYLNPEPPKELVLEKHSPLDQYTCEAEDGRFWINGDPPKPGFIYAFDSSHGTKIGLSKDPEQRFKSIQAAIPFQISIMAVIPVADMPTRENALHNHFSRKRIRGEWFKITKKDKEWIKSLVPTNFVYPASQKIEDSEIDDFSNIPF